MKIELASALYISEVGKRQNNEDAVYPPAMPINLAEGIFVVCDGVGGAAKGEVASRLACDSLAKELKAYNHADIPPNEVITIFNNVHKLFKHTVEEHTEYEGMATTVTLLYVAQSSIMIAHLGDSRIYHYGSEAIKFQTTDHSLVEYLIKTGEITREEALHHPRRNMILRAMHSSEGKHDKPDVQYITNLQEDDYFFLCTDGILEAITERMLVNILASPIEDSQKLELIRNSCAILSKDNYTAYLVRVGALTL